MKVVLDLSRLRDENKISQAEYDKLIQFAMHETSSLAFNILVGFGVIAVSCAIIALVPTAITTIVMGVLTSALGLSPIRNSPKWQLLSQICVLIGSLLLSAGILWMFQASTVSWVLVTLLLAVAGIVIRHGLLIVLSLLALAATVGSGGGYDYATYSLVVERPTVTVVLFGMLSYIAYRASYYLSSAYQHLAILASRTSLFLVNLGFWVGSLWGDQFPDKTVLPDYVFAVVWAIALIGIGVWAVRANRRWVLNVCAVFGAIHFYTQWFNYLGASPATVLLAGLIALGFAFGIRYLNLSFEKSTDSLKQ